MKKKGDRKIALKHTHTHTHEIQKAFFSRIETK